MAITAGGSFNSVPAPVQQALSSNYLDLSSTSGWGQQDVPDLMEQEAEVFGPRTISGFLAQVGAEEAMTADQVIWSEQGRLHLSYIGNIKSAKAGAATGDGGTANVSQFTIDDYIDQTSVTAANHGVRVNEMGIRANSAVVYKC